MHDDLDSEPSAQAGFWRRALAAVIDCAVVNLLYLGLLAIGRVGMRLGLNAAGARAPSIDLVTTLILPTLAIWLLLATLYIAYFTRVGGQTPGKMLLGIRVVGSDDADPNWGQALLRPLGYAVSWLTGGAGFLLAAIPPGKRALHDLLTGTQVVRVSRDDVRLRTVLARPMFFATLVVCSLFGGIGSPASAALVDRIVAVANGRVITAGDLTAYRTLLAPEREATDASTEALLERTLLIEEADRFAIDQPDETLVTQRVDAVVRRMGGDPELNRALSLLGWSRDDFRTWIADDLRIAGFLDQRIYFFVLISPDDVIAHYESHRDDYPGLTLDQAREAITQRLTRERGNERQQRFVAQLREKAVVRINPPISSDESQPAH
jgi:uncharacterized RDD family membrane protein YckC